MSVINRSEGLTVSERRLKRLCDGSFLSLWSYPNLYRKPGHELCDLLVKFDKHILIFSDKSCAFPSSGALEKDWKRWYRRAIADSVKQLLGAERSIRSHPERIFLDPQCTKRWPFVLDRTDGLRFHRIVIASGAASACKSRIGGTGSLMLCPLLPNDSDAYPFTIVQPADPANFVHVLNEPALEVILRELDTISDFTAYLAAKEDLVRDRRLLAASSEEDLLAAYLSTLDSEDRHAFPAMDPGGVLIVSDGEWINLKEQPAYFARRKHNEISYFWDSLIEEFSKNIAGGMLAIGREHSFEMVERGIRVLAAETRTDRRMLSIAFHDLARRMGSRKSSTRLVLSPRRVDIGYIFCIVGSSSYNDYARYRKARMDRLHAYCLVAKHLHPSLTDIVGIGMDSPDSSGHSEDLVYLDASVWTPELANQARGLHEAGLFRTTTDWQVTGDEFPALDPATLEEYKRLERNKKKRERRQAARRRA